MNETDPKHTWCEVTPPAIGVCTSPSRQRPCRLARQFYVTECQPPMWSASWTASPCHVRRVEASRPNLAQDEVDMVAPRVVAKGRLLLTTLQLGNSHRRCAA